MPSNPVLSPQTFGNLHFQNKKGYVSIRNFLRYSVFFFFYVGVVVSDVRM